MKKCRKEGERWGEREKGVKGGRKGNYRSQGCGDEIISTHTPRGPSREMFQLETSLQCAGEI